MDKTAKIIGCLRSSIGKLTSGSKLTEGFPHLEKCPYGNLETRLAVVFLQPFVHAFGENEVADGNPDESELTPELRAGMLEVCERASSVFPSYDEIVEETREVCGSRIRSLCAMPDEEYGNVMQRLGSMNVQAGIDDEGLRILHSYAFDCFFAFLAVVGRRHESGQEMEDAAWALNDEFDRFYHDSRGIILGDGQSAMDARYETVNDVVGELRARIAMKARALFDDQLLPRFPNMMRRGNSDQLIALIGYWGCLHGSGLFMTSVGVLRYMELFRGVSLGPRVEESFENAMGQTLKSFCSDLITRNAPRVPNEATARKRLCAEEILEMLLGPGSGDGRKYVFDDICSYLDFCFSEYARLADIEKIVACAKTKPVVIDILNSTKASEVFLRGLGEWERKNYATAVKMLECAAKLGHMTAASIAAEAYLKGREIPHDGLAAAALYERNANRGDELAMLQVALYNVQGKGSMPNYDRAIEMATPLAEKGNAEAMHCMGLAHLQLAMAGQKSHFKDAFSWLERAANKEFKETHFGWSDDDAHYDSWGKDPDETPEADHARADATLLLGLMYEKGLATVADRVKARNLYQLAIKRGSEQAKRALEKLDRGELQIDLSWEGYFDFLWRSSEDFIKDFFFAKYPEIRSHVGLSGATLTLAIASHLAVKIQRDELIGEDESYDRYGGAIDDADTAVENGVAQMLPDSLPEDLYSRMTAELQSAINPDMMKFMLDMYGNAPEMRATAKITQIGQSVCQSFTRKRGLAMMELGDASSCMNKHFSQCYNIYLNLLERLS